MGLVLLNQAAGRCLAGASVSLILLKRALAVIFSQTAWILESNVTELLDLATGIKIRPALV